MLSNVDILQMIEDNSIVNHSAHAVAGSVETSGVDKKNNYFAVSKV